MEIYYKFINIPEIFILKFWEPKKNITSFKFRIENNIDLKKHLKTNDINKAEYELLKVLYMYKNENDNKLYDNLNGYNKNDYIPYIIFYRKK